MAPPADAAPLEEELLDRKPFHPDMTALLVVTMLTLIGSIWFSASHLGRYIRTEEDKMAFLREAFSRGVRNIEMESLCFASMCHHAGIKGEGKRWVCVVVLVVVVWGDGVCVCACVCMCVLLGVVWEGEGVLVSEHTAAQCVFPPCTCACMGRVYRGARRLPVI